MALMTPEHPHWKTFLARLAGPEGCFFRRVDGQSVWDCTHEDKRKAQALLYHFEVEVPASLAWFEAQGAACDCAILFTLSPQAQTLKAQREAARQEDKRLEHREARQLGNAARKRLARRLERRRKLQALSEGMKQSRLRDIRRLLGVTQQQFALLLQETSPTAFRTISLMEHRLRGVPDRLLERAEAVLRRYTHEPAVLDEVRQVAPGPSSKGGRPRNPVGVTSPSSKTPKVMEERYESWEDERGESSQTES